MSYDTGCQAEENCGLHCHEAPQKAYLFGLVTVHIIWVPMNTVMGWANKLKLGQ